FLGTLVVAKREKTYQGSVPLVTFGAVTACIIAVFTIASGAIILIPTYLMSIGVVQNVDPLMYRTIWWAFGHSSQQINVATHISVWYLVAAIAFGARPMSERVSRGAFLLYILFLQLASAHHLLADPGMSTEWKVVNTSYFMYFAVLASMIHGLTIPGAMEVAQRQKGFTKGLFEWLRKAPWGNPVFSGVFISILGFGFLGGISGVMMGTEQLNMIIHNTIYVPGHFHATVVVGTTLTFMALTYYLIPVLFRREMVAPKLAKWQPYLFGFSMYFFCLVMMGAGTLGVSRRHWDMAFTGVAMAYEWPGAAYLMMGLVAIAGLAAIAGGAIYIYVTVGSILWGKRLDAGSETQKATPVPPTTPAAVVQSHGSLGFAAPGTFTLAMVFLVAFVLYYFINWKYLSTLWGLS
ncbi:MAG TPA: cbb3-type cytochrome c oxidase subunit I, partial [Steroidobacter sp.]|nr:cbb3-type cytochrome c oxidase subunit I [Steroidobacter sp.]